MNPLFTKLLILSSLFISSCQKPLFPDDDGPATENADWEKIDFPCERQLLGLYATPIEWYAITDNQFFRFDGDDELLEIRPLAIRSGAQGVPVLTDNAFFRMTTAQDNRQILEFHHARNPASVINIPVDSLEKEENAFLDVEYHSRQLGAFNKEGTLFLLPVIVMPQQHYSFYLFEISYEDSFQALASVKLVKQIDIPDMDVELAILKSMRFFDGNFYVASAKGAWRIGQDGIVEQIFPQWMLDFFSYDGKLYATGLNTFDLHSSSDNGLTWERLNQYSEIKYVETADTTVFSEPTLGNPYQIVSDDLAKAKNIVYPSEAPSDPSVYFSVVFFANKYYFSMDRTVYTTSDIVAE